MTTKRIKAIGICARMTEVGDRAFRFARDLARRHAVPLDIFVFPTSPCEAHERRGRRGENIELSEHGQVEIERDVRFYYDDLLEDQDLDVGFRLCLGDEAPELRSCLFDRQFDILVLAYERRLCPFGKQSIEEFARSMACPVVLVGPGQRDEIHLNIPATIWVEALGLEEREWKHVKDAAAVAAGIVPRTNLRLRKQVVLTISPEELAELLAAAVVLSEDDTKMCGPIRILDLDGTVAVQEQAREGEILLRGMPSVVEARRFVDERLDAYERLWDGCGCKIDYHS